MNRVAFPPSWQLLFSAISRSPPSISCWPRRLFSLVSAYMRIACWWGVSLSLPYLRWVKPPFSACSFLVRLHANHASTSSHLSVLQSPLSLPVSFIGFPIWHCQRFLTLHSPDPTCSGLFPILPLSTLFRSCSVVLRALSLIWRRCSSSCCLVQTHLLSPAILNWAHACHDKSCALSPLT